MWAASHPNLEPKVSFGIVIGARFDLSNPEHRGRRVYRGHGGYGVVANKWSEIIKAVRRLREMSGTVQNTKIKHLAGSNGQYVLACPSTNYPIIKALSGPSRWVGQVRM
jgi:hypothetical protein